MSPLDLFPDLATLSSEARRTSRADFMRQHPEPALVLRAINVPGAKEPGADLTPRELSFQRTVGSPGSTAAATYDGRVAFLRRKPGSPFPSFVTLGRALNNDVVIALGTISKLHGLFWVDGETFAYQDQESTNGTVVNGKVLAKGERRALADRDGLTLGLDIAATFFLSPTLWDQLRR